VARSYVVRLSGAGNVEIVVEPLEDAASAKPPIPKPVPVSTTEPPHEAEGSSNGTGQRIFGWSMVAIGVAGLGTGGYFAARGIEQKAQSRNAEGSAALEANESAKQSFRTGGFSLVGGTVAIGVGILMLVTAPSSSPKKAASARVVPSGGPTGGGIDLVGTF
jgi:hypothetical protein